MRKKTEERRRIILDVATRTFREMGFQNTSMSEIATRLGGSKATLYNYFPSKEAILLEVMRSLADQHREKMYSLLDQPFPAITKDSQHLVEEVFSELLHPVDDISASLSRFGAKFLEFLCSPEMLAIRRMLVAESGRSEIGRFYYESGPQKGMDRIAAFLKAVMEAGQLRLADPNVAAAHLIGLLKSEVYDRYLLNVDELVSEVRINQAVENAVLVFLAAYGKK
jgi:AcrR family transcriptional regulator